MFDYHVHLHRGPYALDWLDRFLDTARQVGVTELGIAEHFYFFRESFPILDNDFVRRHTEQRLNGPGGYPGWIGDWGFDLDPRSWEGRSVAESYDRYYTILARAAESGLFDILGHCLEINSGGLRRPCRHLFPREETLSEVRRAGLPIVVSSDAHGPEEVGYGFTRVRALLRNAGFAETSRFTNRQRTLATL